MVRRFPDPCFSRESAGPARCSAVSPVGLNHLILNVRDLDESHAFWADSMGFEQVGELHATPDPAKEALL
ncbi:MAG: catechol-2,3-dioxygenase [Gammaproteobacteria bacterium]|jgi:catechol-2,3-dioxygenase